MTWTNRRPERREPIRSIQGTDFHHLVVPPCSLLSGKMLNKSFLCACSFPAKIISEGDESASSLSSLKSWEIRGPALALSVPCTNHSNVQGHVRFLWNVLCGANSDHLTLYIMCNYVEFVRSSWVGFYSQNGGKVLWLADHLTIRLIHLSLTTERQSAEINKERILFLWKPSVCPGKVFRTDEFTPSVFFVTFVRLR